MTSPRDLARRARRAVDRWRSSRTAAVVTVVVPVYQAEAYLDECLTSLRAQSHSRLQIVLVDDGSTDGSRAIYERHAAADDRIEVLQLANSGPGGARNAGIARARGDYLTFLDADDILPPRAYHVMVAALEKSGSDFAVGAVQRVTGGRRSTPPWIREVHRDAHRAITIDDYPRAVMDVILCNRMFRTSAWSRLGLSFPVGVAYEDHLPMMTAYVRGRFDILQETTYLWRIREDRTSMGQQKHTLANLRDRLEAKRAAREVVQGEASAAVLDAWQARVLDMDLRLFIDEVPGVDEEYWATLRDGVREHVDLATPAAWADVRVEQRVRAWLVAHDHRPELESLLRRSAAGEDVVHARVVGDGVAALVELPEAVLPPAELLVVGDRELELQVWLRSVTVEDEALVLVLAPRVGPLVDGLEDAELVVRLRDAEGRSVTLGTRPAGPEAVQRWRVPLSGPRCPDVRALRLAQGSLPDGDASWTVEAAYTVGARQFRAPVQFRDGDGPAGRAPALVSGGRRIATRWARRSGLEIEVTHDRHGTATSSPPPARPLLLVDDAEVRADGLVLRGRWLGEPPDGPMVLEAAAQSPIEVEHSAEGARAVLRVCWEQPPAPGTWRLRAPGAQAASWLEPGLLARLPLVETADDVRLGVIRDTDEAPALRVVRRR